MVQSGTKAVVPGEGLPTLEGGKGDLRIVFDITFPKTLSEAQKSILKSAFFLPKSLTDRQAGAVKTYMSAFKHDTEGWATLGSCGYPTGRHCRETRGSSPPGRFRHVAERSGSH